MIDREIIEKELRSIIAARMPDKPDPDTIASNVPIFQKGLGLDSMSGLDLVAAIEKRFDLYIDDDDFDIFDSLERMIDYVAEKAGGTDS